jgi:prefoldin beta subunit
MSSKVNQLQLLQQNLQMVSSQKQQLQTQVVEYNSALKELVETNQAYKIVGKIMFATSKDELTKDLNEKKEVAELRLKNFTKQEDKLKESIEETQKEVMEEMQKEKQEENKSD